MKNYFIFRNSLFIETEEKSVNSPGLSTKLNSTLLIGENASGPKPAICCRIDLYALQQALF